MLIYPQVAIINIVTIGQNICYSNTTELEKGTVLFKLKENFTRSLQD